MDVALREQVASWAVLREQVAQEGVVRREDGREQEVGGRMSSSGEKGVVKGKDGHENERRARAWTIESDKTCLLKILKTTCGLKFESGSDYSPRWCGGWARGGIERRGLDIGDRMGI
jgi:hypothetical protein